MNHDGTTLSSEETLKAAALVLKISVQRTGADYSSTASKEKGVMDHDPPEDKVLRELGRLTWEAICLEDCAQSLCRVVKPRGDVYDDTPISTRIDKARADLADRPDSDVLGDVDGWLVRARDALQARNRVLHAVPLDFVPWPGTEPTAGTGPALYYFPRPATGEDRDAPRRIHATRVEVADLGRLADRLRAVREDWVSAMEKLG